MNSTGSRSICIFQSALTLEDSPRHGTITSMIEKNCRPDLNSTRAVFSQLFRSTNRHETFSFTNFSLVRACALVTILERNPSSNYGTFGDDWRAISTCDATTYTKKNTAPSMVLNDGTWLTDSWQIAAWADNEVKGNFLEVKLDWFQRLTVLRNVFCHCCAPWF